MFIKINEIVINTNYIATIKLESQTYTGDRSISILMATPRFPLLAGADVTSPDLYHYEWLHFTGREAQGLRDYFSSYNNVIDLLPEQEPVVSVQGGDRERSRERGRSEDPG